MTAVQNPSPGGSSISSHQSLVQHRHRNKGNYVQRWKVLRDRNKNLPKLDFIAKASGIPKKFHGTGSFSRSYTYDSMKLPSISTCSVITGVSGRSVHSEGYRGKDGTRNRNIQVSLHFERWKYNQPRHYKDQHSDSYLDLNSQREYRDLAAALSKSLQSLIQEEKPHQEDVKSKPDSNHRYESISYKKHLLKRQRGNVVQAPDNSKKSRDVKKNSKTGISGVRKPAEREYVFVKEHTAVSPGLHLNIGRKEEPYLRGKKSELHALQQSGIYQIDLSEVRNEIPPVSHEPLPPVSSAKTERSYRARKHARSSRYKMVDKKWRDNCDCLRCDIMKRQFVEGDMRSYHNWGDYPCMKLSKSRASSDMYFYDSD